MGAAQDALAADPGFQKRVKENAHVSPVRSRTPSASSSRCRDRVTAPQFVTIVIAQCAAGKLADAMAWGVDMMQYSSKLTGLDGSLVHGLYGAFATAPPGSRSSTRSNRSMRQTRRCRATRRTSNGSIMVVSCSFPGRVPATHPPTGVRKG